MERAGGCSLAQRQVPIAFLGRSRPENPPLVLGDWHVVDACLAANHQPVLVELPELVAVAPPPLAVGVAALVLVANGDPVLFEAPKALSKRVIELPLPL